MIKWNIPAFHNVAAYFGLKHTFDGLQIFVGFKAGAVKLMFPILLMNEPDSPQEETEDEEHTNVQIGVSYLIFSLGLSYLQNRKLKKQIEEWRQN